LGAHAKERTAVPITNEDLARFAGTYSMSSGMTFTFTIKANALELDASGEIMPVVLLIIWHILVRVIWHTIVHGLPSLVSRIV
jgi:hypothetical protein